MTAPPTVLTAIDPVLVKLHEAVTTHFGNRLERMVLYGSRARGDHRPDSDYDVAIFVRDLGELWDELKAMGPVTLSLLVDDDAEVNTLLFPAGTWQSTAFALMHEIRRDGRDI